MTSCTSVLRSDVKDVVLFGVGLNRNHVTLVLAHQITVSK